MPLATPDAQTEAASTSVPRHATPRNIRRTTLPNGLLVLTEQMSHMRSVSMGAWLRHGARDESAPANGISHFVEHMLFKGTTSRSAQQIARETDAIGGNLDAFTGKETVCFSIKSLDENLPQALDILSDLVLHPQFSPDDLAREQDVILEEIRADEDSPESVVHEIFTRGFWPDHPLGRPILGTAETVSSFTQQTVLDHHRRHFSPAGMIFSAAGNLEHERFVDLVSSHFGSMHPDTTPFVDERAPRATPHVTLRKKKSLEQVQLCLAVEAPPVDSPDRFALYLMNSILGGGMSSRLFQSIREDAGLAYSIFSELSPFRDTGSLAIYAGISPAKIQQALQLTLAELRRLTSEPVSSGELERARNQMKSNVVLGLESSGSRMSNLARQQMYFGRFLPLDEITAEVDRVTPDDLQRLARTLFRPEQLTLTLLGNLGTLKLDRSALASSF